MCDCIDIRIILPFIGWSWCVLRDLYRTHSTLFIPRYVVSCSPFRAGLHDVLCSSIWYHAWTHDTSWCEDVCHSPTICTFATSAAHYQHSRATLPVPRLNGNGPTALLMSSWSLRCCNQKMDAATTKQAASLHFHHHQRVDTTSSNDFFPPSAFVLIPTYVDQFLRM